MLRKVDLALGNAAYLPRIDLACELLGVEATRKLRLLVTVKVAGDIVDDGQGGVCCLGVTDRTIGEAIAAIESLEDVDEILDLLPDVKDEVINDVVGRAGTSEEALVAAQAQIAADQEAIINLYAHTADAARQAVIAALSDVDILTEATDE